MLSKCTHHKQCSPQAPAAVMKFAKSPRQGAETSVQLALGDDSNGGYWVDGKSLGSNGGNGGNDLMVADLPDQFG